MQDKNKSDYSITALLALNNERFSSKIYVYYSTNGVKYFSRHRKCMIMYIRRRDQLELVMQNTTY